MALERRRQRAIEINRYVIERGLDRQLVLYWYQSHGRVVASEYWGKIYTVVDAVRLNRTDAALVRVITPIPEATPQAEQAAEARADRVRSGDLSAAGAARAPVSVKE